MDYNEILGFSDLRSNDIDLLVRKLTEVIYSKQLDGEDLFGISRYAIGKYYFHNLGNS